LCCSEAGQRRRVGAGAGALPGGAGGGRGAARRLHHGVRVLLAAARRVRVPGASRPARAALPRCRRLRLLHPQGPRGQYLLVTHLLG
jgi:hypothetical protein